MASRRLRWLLPGGIVAGIGAVALAVPSLSATAAAPTLPPKTANQLLTDLGRAAEADLPGLSGTVETRADLGLPALPSQLAGNDVTSLLSGSRTARIWYAGKDRVRGQLLGTLSETDVIRNGRDLWTYDSTANRATHVTLPVGGDAAPGDLAQVPTPQQAARQALGALDPTTAVSVDGTARVAGRAAYELVLRPRDAASLVGSVRLAVDSATSVPLRVQVFARGKGSPAVEVGFRSVSFAVPPAKLFAWTPPPGAKVTERGVGRAPTREPAAGDVRTVGDGWTTVAVLRGVDTGNETLRSFLRGGQAVAGGRVLRSDLVTALVTDDGRVLVGAVTPDKLTAVARSSR